MPEDHRDEDQTKSFIPLTKGTEVGHYKIISKIGAGGMGEVYLAEDEKLHRKVALKFMPAHMAGNADMRARFTREAQAAAKLDHPNIVPVYEVGEYQDRPYFAMAHVEGRSLREVIKEGKLSINDAVDLTMQVLEGLHKAHESGVVHRDIKPGNIIINKDGRARLVDFGLAMVAGEDKLTKTGSTVGTVGYMSPEQVEGKKCDHRSDLFSVGVILYEMLTGRRPFEGDNDAAIIRAITGSTPEPVARYKSGTTGELQQIIDKALTKDPSLRYQHADGMLADLKRSMTTSESDRGSLAQPKLSRLVNRFLVPTLVLIIAVLIIVLKPWELEIRPTKDAFAVENRLAIMYFDNLVDLDDRQKLGEITTNLLITDLSGTENLNVVSSQRLYDILNLIGRKGEKNINRNIATKVAEKARAQWMLLGSILKTDPNLVLSAQLVEVASGTAIISRKIEGEIDEDIFSLVDKLSIEITKELSPSKMSGRITDVAISDITTNSIDAYRHYLEGVEYYFNFEYRKAEASFHRALEYDSTFAMAYYRLSLSGMQDKDRKEMIEKALQYSDKVTKLELLIIKSREAYFSNDKDSQDREIECLHKIIEHDPEYKEAYFRLGKIHREEKCDYVKAIGYYEKAIEIDSLYKPVYNDIAYAYWSNGDKEKSIWAINKYVALNPGEANPYDSRGELYAFNGQLDLAIESYKRALEIDPDFYYSNVHLGHMYVFNREYDNAEESYQKVASSDDKNYRSLVRMYLGYPLIWQGQFQDAIKLLNDGLAADKMQHYDKTWHSSKHILKASIFIEMGKFADAVESAQNAFDQDAAICSYFLVQCGYQKMADSLMNSVLEYIEKENPEYIDYYWRCKGFAHVAGSIGDSAVYYLEKVIDARGRGLYDYSLGFMLANAYFQTGNLPQAIEEFEKIQFSYNLDAIFFSTLFIKGHYYLGRAYESSNWRNKAIEQYEHFIDIWKDAQPPVPEVQDARERLANLKNMI